ncbi:MAG: VWA domain-containing protein [Pseudomonadota bacterium]
MLDFADPLFLLLLPVPLLVLYLRRRARLAGAALAVPEGVGARLGLASARGGAGMGQRMLPILIWICLVTALAGPRLAVANPALPVSGRDLVLALDLSGSMIREDFELDGRQIQRLDAVKHAATQFVRARAGDRVALVIFASRAYFATPQTFDVEAVARAVEGASIGISGRATGISEGLGLALKRLAASQAASKVVVLLSDGVNNSGPVKPREAAQLAARQGVRVHTIAMGPRDLSNAEGERDAVDAETLQAIADLSGGASFRVRTTQDLLAVGEAINALEATPADGPSAIVRRQLWTWPAMLGFLLTLGLVVGPAMAGARR